MLLGFPYSHVAKITKKKICFVGNKMSFGGNSNQTARIPFQNYGAGITPNNYTGKRQNQQLKTERNKSQNPKTI